jgi:hypothetical protein
VPPQNLLVGCMALNERGDLRREIRICVRTMMKKRDKPVLRNAF